MPHPSALRAWHPSTPLEQGLYRVLRLSWAGSAATLVSFVAYLCIGLSLHLAGIYTPPFALLSFSDPVFVILGFLIGGFICLFSGSLTLLTLLASVKDAKAYFVLLMSLIAFGFGAATVRVTADPALSWFVAFGSV